MKKIPRMLIFSATSLFILTRFNSGVVLPLEWKKIFIGVLLITFIYYIVNPILKILLLPINILTLGISSFVAYIVIFITVNDYLNLIKFESWHFPGIYNQYLIIQKFTLSPMANKIFSAFFIAFFISLLEMFL